MGTNKMLRQSHHTLLGNMVMNDINVGKASQLLDFLLYFDWGAVDDKVLLIFNLIFVFVDPDPKLSFG